MTETEEGHHRALTRWWPSQTERRGGRRSAITASVPASL